MVGRLHQRRAQMTDWLKRLARRPRDPNAGQEPQERALAAARQIQSLDRFRGRPECRQSPDCRLVAQRVPQEPLVPGGLHNWPVAPVASLNWSNRHRQQGRQ